MSANDQTDDLQSSRSKCESSTDGSAKRRRGSPENGLSKALRTVYDDTLREEVPDDFMDLLGKLN